MYSAVSLSLRLFGAKLPQRLGEHRMVTIALVALAGFAVGRNNDAFLTCEDFKIAGSDQPENCAPA